MNFTDFPTYPIPPNHSIWNYQDQSIELRGFWYTIPNDEGGFLSFQPNLKSCCIGHSHLIHQQIRVNESYPHLKNDRVVNLRGIFKIDPKHDINGRLIQLYVLHSTKVIDKNSNLGCLSIVLLLLFSLFFFFFLRRLKNNNITTNKQNYTTTEPLRKG